MSRWQYWIVKPWVVAIVLGTAACLYAIPYEMLDPTNFSWMNRTDTFAHWLGWEQFRDSPVLQLPLGKSDRYGLENSTTIVFSDSIPLVALLLHPIEWLLPRPFQYLGLWTLACFILQAYFAYRLMLRLFARPAAAMAAVLMFLMSAPMLNRIHVHTSLMSHWLVLAGILLYLEAAEWRWRRWALLVVLSVLVHGYLFGMVAALWSAHLLKMVGLGALRGGPMVFARQALNALAVVVTCGAVMWLSGYFGVKGPQFHIYGMGRYDLAGAICTREIWSQLIPDVGCQSRANDWDGQSFLGIGVMVVLLVTVVRYAWARWAGRGAPVVAASPADAIPPASPTRLPLWPLAVVGAFLLAFAATNEVSAFGVDLFSYPLPKRWLQMAETFRSSGRMTWPLFYLALFAIMGWFARVVPARWHVWILLPAGLLQWVDMRSGIKAVNVQIAEIPVVTDLPSPLWKNLSHYERLISIPAVGGQPFWQDLVWQASKYGLASNMGLFNRNDLRRAAEGRLHWLHTLTEQRLDPQAVYLIPGQGLWDAARELKGPDDVVIRIDGHLLLFPGGARHGLRDDATPPLAPLPLGQWRTVGEGGDGNAYLTNGWSWMETWGRWNNSTLAGLTIAQPPSELGRDRTVVLEVVPYKDREEVFRPQPYTVRAWSTVVAEGVLQASDSLITFTVPGALNVRKWLFLELQMPDATLARDGRQLSIGLKRLWISDQPGTMPSLLTPAQQQMVEAPPEAAHLPLGEWREVGDKKPGDGYLLRGWSWPEPWGRWSAHTTVSLALPQAGELGLPTLVKLDVIARTTANVPAQPYRISVAGAQLAEGTLPEGESILSFTVPAALTARRTIVVDIGLPEAEVSSDGRLLAIGLRRVALERPE